MQSDAEKQDKNQTPEKSFHNVSEFELKRYKT